MTSTIHLPAVLARLTGGETKIPTTEPNLGQALHELSNKFSLGFAVLNEEGEIQPYVKLVINDSILPHKQIQDLQSIKLDNTSIEIKTAFAGG